MSAIATAALCLAAAGMAWVTLAAGVSLVQQPDFPALLRFVVEGVVLVVLIGAVVRRLRRQPGQDPPA